MKGFDWVNYIAATVRNAGYRDYREGQEKTHEVVVKLLTGKLFRGFDQHDSGPIDLRFKRSVANAVKNLVELDRNRRHYLPTVPIQQTFTPGGVTADRLPARSVPTDDEEAVENFRKLLRDRLGGLAVAVFDLRLAGRPSRWSARPCSAVPAVTSSSGRCRTSSSWHGSMPARSATRPCCGGSRRRWHRRKRRARGGGRRRRCGRDDLRSPLSSADLRQD